MTTKRVEIKKENGEKIVCTLIQEGKRFSFDGGKSWFASRSKAYRIAKESGSLFNCFSVTL